MKKQWTLVEVTYEGENENGSGLYYFTTVYKIATNVVSGRSLYLRSIDVAEKNAKRLRKLGWHIKDIAKLRYFNTDGIVEVW